jgi:transposase
MSTLQLGLFDEAEATVAAEAEVEAAPVKTRLIAAHERVRPVRKPLPDFLPRVRIEHDLADADKLCSCGCGPMRRIGEEISEQLDIIPAQVQVLQHVRFQYACKACAEGVVIAPLPPQPIPKSNASPGLLAFVAISKYQDALPLYRLETVFARSDIEIPRATSAGWMIRSGELVQPLINLIAEHLLGYDILQIDETRIQVLKEDGRRAESQSFMWVRRGGPASRPAVLFDYDPSRGQCVARRLIDGFEGYLQSDGYEVYAAVARGAAIVSLGCWAHARRKFVDAIKALGKTAKAGQAHKGLALIQPLYLIEREIKDLDPEQRKEERQKRAAPQLAEIRAWIDTALPQVPPKSATGQALGYLHSQWPRLIRYLDDGRLDIDNNACERAIRPFTLGRKNWLFSATPKGANASANLYSLIETAKANGIEPYRYLKQVFEQLPAATCLEDIEALLPWRVASQGRTVQDGVG